MNQELQDEYIRVLIHQLGLFECRCRGQLFIGAVDIQGRKPGDLLIGRGHDTGRIIIGENGLHVFKPYTTTHKGE
jgi:hypothetical protein